MNKILPLVKEHHRALPALRHNSRTDRIGWSNTNTEDRTGTGTENGWLKMPGQWLGKTYSKEKREVEQAQSLHLLWCL